MITSLPPGALGIGEWSGKVALRWYSTGGSTQAWFPVLDLQLPGQRWAFAGREADTLSFRFEVLRMLPEQLFWVCSWRFLRLEKLETGTSQR